MFVVKVIKIWGIEMESYLQNNEHILAMEYGSLMKFIAVFYTNSITN